MWADSKTVRFLKFGSTFQKLFNVEKWRPTPLEQFKKRKFSTFYNFWTAELNLQSSTNLESALMRQTSSDFN